MTISLVDIKGMTAVDVASTIRQLIARANYAQRVDELLMDSADRNLVKELTEFSNEDYCLASEQDRQRMAQIPVIELVKLKGLRFFIYRMVTGNYKIRCFADSLEFDEILMDTYLDAIKLVEYINRPSAKDLRAMISHRNKLKFMESGKSDFDQAMRQG